MTFINQYEHATQERGHDSATRPTSIRSMARELVCSLPTTPWQVFLSNPKLNLSDTRMPLYDQDPVVGPELLWSRHDAPPQELLKCRLVNM